MAEGGPKDPKREDAGVSGTSLLNASGGSITVEGRKDGLGALGVPNCELGVCGMPMASAPSAGAGDGALADGVS